MSTLGVIKIVTPSKEISMIQEVLDGWCRTMLVSLSANNADAFKSICWAPDADITEVPRANSPPP